MDIVIIKLNTNFYENKNFFGAMEKLGHNFVGFVALGHVDGIPEIDGYNFYSAEYIQRLKYDLALIDCNMGDVKKYLPALAHFKVPLNKLRTSKWLLQQLISRKYEDVQDPVIQETLRYWQTYDISVFNQHFEGLGETMHEVYMDETINLPYIIFQTVEGKDRRMYYPRGRSFEKGEDGKKYVKDILREQIPTSPHLYVKGNHKVDEGDVLIDAGVCEGNFALRYADICSKIFLFEPDKQWFEPLYYSFRDCWDKVEFIPKAVAEHTGGGSVALDDAVKIPFGSKIFIKMDVEGAEPAALRGAKKILSTNKVKASICSYHRADDIIKIKAVFQNLGYKTATSAGYMIFIYDPKIWETTDFRKGIVYATNY